ncbi:MAG TPA: type IV secretory system conjugative DNA transfer family protein [Terriglobia bacterium]|nr:type IV secretory system conjugative DNA transfer family protein [Terriglobia bacterium]
MDSTGAGDSMRAREANQETGVYDGAFIVAAVGVALFIAVWYVAIHRYHLLDSQFIEALGYLVVPATGLGCLAWLILTGHSRRENAWPHPYQVISPKKDEPLARDAWRKDAVVLGYDVHGKPWLWPDRIRVMQGLVLGLTGMGKTTLLKNIITQDLMRVIDTPEGPRRMPILILDGKGERKLFEELLPHIHHAGRLGDLRVINPSWPDISVRYNPFHCTQDDYMPVVNMVFGSFNLHDEFFGKHQLNYLADIVRVLVYTGHKFNFYDVLVMAIDPEVLQEQVAKAIHETTRMPNMTLQRRLNFEMSVKNLYQSFQDRERVPKIQGLLNECMTFLDDELSIITGPYEDLLSLDEVIEKGLILFLSLNVNKNTEPVRALGKMLLQNVQLVVGRRYEADDPRAACRPMTSIILDEFAPFGYQNFAHILQTARGTNTSFLFSMQSVPQLLKVGRGFKEDVTSAANTIITFKTHDETTADFFLQASALRPVTKRTRSVRRVKFFGYERYRETGDGSEREDLETRALDYHIKNLPTGQIELLMTDETQGTLHTTLSVRPPADIRVPGFEPEVFPRLTASRAESKDGAHLRFKNLEFASRHGRRATTGWGGRVQ